MDSPLGKLLRVSVPINLAIASHQERPSRHEHRFILRGQSHEARRGLLPLGSPLGDNVGNVVAPARHSQHGGGGHQGGGQDHPRDGREQPHW
jgi:hypothetical protein